jgi:hypothetical protein
MNSEHFETLNDLDVKQALEAAKKNGSVDLAVSQDFSDQEDEELYDERQKALSDYFDRKELEFTKHLGAPVFKGGAGDDGFPEDYVEHFFVYPDFVVMWERAGDRYALTFSQEDREFPFAVTFARFP